VIRRFNRFELKYIVPASLHAALVSDLRPHMAPDAHGGETGYRITSLYYDSRDLVCYWAKREGIKHRRKVRVRIYGDSAERHDEQVLVEIKQRIDRTVQKRRVRLPLALAYELCEGRSHPALDDPLDRAVVSEVEFLVRSLHLHPSCVISYLRQAWVGGPYEPGLRVTFDAQLVCRGPELRLAGGLARHSVLSPSFLVLEVKANEKVPIWVSRVIAKHGLRLRRISKYCEGVARLRGLPRGGDLSMPEP
jgi:hypothetical protein